MSGVTDLDARRLEHYRSLRLDNHGVVGSTLTGLTSRSMSSPDRWVTEKITLS